MKIANTTILVASDSVGDAAMIKRLIEAEYEQVHVSTNPSRVVEDFEQRTPAVLVLAFNQLEKAESYYLGLYRLSSKVHVLPHRTVILCNKDEVNRVYQSCKKGHFDDYVLFWPMSNDNPRLLMSLHHMLQDLAEGQVGGPSAAEFAAQARRLNELGGMLDQQMQQGSQRIDQASTAMERVEQEINAMLDATLGADDNLQQQGMKQRLHLASESVQPIRQWVDELRLECAPHIKSARSLKALADQFRPTILIVDDDTFQFRVISELLDPDYRLVFAESGIDALNLLRKLQPDLILMDIMMPEMDGIETTRRIKSMFQLANVPVIMVTGKSEGGAVRESLKVGAIDFVVKPFDGDILQAKVAHALHGLIHAA